MVRASVLVLLGLCACGQSIVVGGSGGGAGGSSGGGGSQGGGTGGSSGGAGGSSGGGAGGAAGGGDGCPVSAKTVYVVDDNNTFSSFDPATKTFHDIGTLSCPTTVSGATPFSMAVDRTATAYVLYGSGELFKVDTGSLNCTRTAFAPLSNHLFKAFGMGFSTDVVGGTSDTLFIAGGPTYSDTSSKLAVLNVASFQPVPVGDLAGWPELTGTGDAELWGFFPSTSPVVAKLNKGTGARLTTWPAPTLAGDPTKWAFAFWGGRFWIFLQRVGDTSTFVYEMNAATGAVSTALSDTGRGIVGAGVSTCAPVMVN